MLTVEFRRCVTYLVELCSFSPPACIFLLLHSLSSVVEQSLTTYRLHGGTQRGRRWRVNRRLDAGVFFSIIYGIYLSRVSPLV